MNGSTTVSFSRYQEYSYDDTSGERTATGQYALKADVTSFFRNYFSSDTQYIHVEIVSYIREYDTDENGNIIYTDTQNEIIRPFRVGRRTNTDHPDWDELYRNTYICEGVTSSASSLSEYLPTDTSSTYNIRLYIKSYDLTDDTTVGLNDIYPSSPPLPSLDDVHSRKDVWISSFKLSFFDCLPLNDTIDGVTADFGSTPIRPPDLTEKAMSKPYPKALWRIDTTKSLNHPWHELLPYTAPIYFPVEQNEYICIYDMETTQVGFNNNGLAVLNPTKCRITEQINGSWNVTLEHPIDSEVKWKFIQDFNILKVQGQLFRITRVEHYYTNYTGMVIANAEHIFYQNNDGIIKPGIGFSPFPVTGKELIRLATERVDKQYLPQQTYYSFDYDSDLSYETVGSIINLGGTIWTVFDKAITLSEFVMGEGGLVATFGGELYRDNFYYSVNTRMEGAKDNAFEIRVGLNLTGIRRTVDNSSLCTYLYTADNHGSTWAGNYTTYANHFPHQIVRYKEFNYPDDGYTSDRFFNDSFQYFVNYCKPTVGFEINIKDVKKNPDYKEFTNNYRYKVGDTGIIYDERLGLNLTMEITKTVTDGITGEVLEVYFGNKLSFVRSSNYSYDVQDGDFVPTVIGRAAQWRDKNGVFLFDKNRVRLINNI